MIYGILPVKFFSASKQRLAGLLSPAEREELARVMFRHTFLALMAARGFDRVLVAAADPRVLAEAAAAGADVAVLRRPGLVFDLDTPEDAAALLERAPDCAAGHFLRRIGAADRLAARLAPR